MQTGVEFLFIIIILHELLLTATLACCGRCEGAKVWGWGWGGRERPGSIHQYLTPVWAANVGFTRPCGELRNTPTTIKVKKQKI